LNNEQVASAFSALLDKIPIINEKGECPLFDFPLDLAISE